ncbi:Uncharacterized protein OBRU01_04664 [Operophtera brumata]|uniref:Uncharacterized protein n=1 Tax=Operophtera brumata TaxID=104452 RepID=A0A0L7LNU8_OPEBR|nr:Uncharacterized protein OBRU01_04664 [Operophtera brumata]
MMKSAEAHDDTRYRTERQINSIPLVYPYGGTYKLLIGFASPVPNKDKIGLLFGVNFQYQYAQFTNISQLSQYYFIKRVTRELQNNLGRDEQPLRGQMNTEGRGDERLVFYKSIADMMTAPDYGRTPFDEEDPDWAEISEEMSPYIDAAVAGRQMFSCQAVYGGCPEGEGLMELISTLRDD